MKSFNHENKWIGINIVKFNRTLSYVKQLNV